jgi:tetratricopeptide (TPR) repeat protein
LAQMQVNGFLGGAYREHGDGAQAIVFLEKAIAQLRAFVGVGAIRYRCYEAYFLAMLSEAYVLAGDLATAGPLARTALEIATVSTWLMARAYARRALATVAQAVGSLDEAEVHLDEALRTFDAIEAPFQVARTRLLLAALAHQRKDREMAGSHLREAFEQFRRLGATRYVDRTEAIARDYGVTLD